MKANKEISLEQRVEELEERLQILEKKEQNRKIWNIIKLILKLIILFLIIFAIWRLYMYLTKLVQPLIDAYSDISNTTKGIDLSGLGNIITSFK